MVAKKEEIPLPEVQLKYLIDTYNYEVGFCVAEEVFLARCLELKTMGFGNTQEGAIAAVKEENRHELSSLFYEGHTIPGLSI